MARRGATAEEGESIRWDGRKKGLLRQPVQKTGGPESLVEKGTRKKF